MYNTQHRREYLNKFFYPKSIALVGASNDKAKIGGYIFSEILKNKDIKPFPINLKETKIQGVKAYPRVSAIGHSVDLVIIAVPAAFVLQTIDDCIAAKSKNIVIITAGFKETGEEGKKREDELKEKIIAHNLNVIGPNCLGFLNAGNGLNCSFAKDIPMFGKTALISQSGAVIDAIIDWSFKHEIGFSKVVSLGNMAGVDELAILEYLKDDPKTNAIVFYMETLEKGRIFGEVLREVTKVKPVIIIKPGTSDAAKQAIGSHTGSLAQDNVLVETLISDNNGILVENLNELFNVMIALQGKYSNKNRLAIVTNAGGPGVISTDAVAKTGFELVNFKKEDRVRFFFLPNEASIKNPIDILGDAKSDRYIETLKVLEKDHSVENILVLLTPQIMTDSENIAREVTKFAHHSEKNYFSSFLGDKEIKKALEQFDRNNFPNFNSPSEALAAMNRLLKYKSFNYKDHYKHYNFDRDYITKMKDKLRFKKGLLDFETTKEIMKTFSIKLPNKIILKDHLDVKSLNLKEDQKYIMKVDSPDLIHKKDVGGVVFGVTSKNASKLVEEMIDNVSKHTTNYKITLEEEVEGAECIVGLKQDPELGPFIMFGMGGTYVSVFKDINFSTCPLSVAKAQKLVESSKVYTILKGFRGSKPIHFEHLYEILVRMSFLQEVYPEIKEVDLNPIICSSKGIYLVDVKLIK